MYFFYVSTFFFGPSGSSRANWRDDCLLSTPPRQKSDQYDWFKLSRNEDTGGSLSGIKVLRATGSNKQTSPENSKREFIYNYHEEGGDVKHFCLEMDLLINEPVSVFYEKYPLRNMKREEFSLFLNDGKVQNTFLEIFEKEASRISKKPHPEKALHQIVRHIFKFAYSSPKEFILFISCITFDTKYFTAGFSCFRNSRPLYASFPRLYTWRQGFNLGPFENAWETWQNISRRDRWAFDFAEGHNFLFGTGFYKYDASNNMLKKVFLLYYRKNYIWVMYLLQNHK